ncbi:MAG: cytochrome C biosynthesis protein [candidate division WOR-3 bacterium]
MKKAILFYIIFFNFWVGCSSSQTEMLVPRSPTISPDYSGITIPPNIAPLNFRIEEKGTQYKVEIQGSYGAPIKIFRKSPIIKIPMKAWKNFLSLNRGNSYKIEIAIKDSLGNWLRFSPIINQIALDSIDSYIAYRRLGPLYTYWKKMGIYQRCIENFEESPILINRLTQENCINCHNFFSNNPEKWLLHLRRGPGTAMLLVLGNDVYKIDTRTAFNQAPVAYPAWHPSGNLIAFSINKLLLFYHSIGEPRDVLDRASDLLIYDIPSNTITTDSQIANQNRMENWPTWSADGKYLYFSSAPKLETYEDPSQKELAYNKIQYDLMRIPFEEKTKTWGKLELVLSASKVGGSINQPRVSPDGNFVLFTVSAYGNFPVYLSSSDLYLLNLSSGETKKLELNTEYTESFHSWSSNSRWIVFSSKRMDHLFSRPYFAYIDKEGNVSKPFILPQKNPSYYETCLENFNVPEFIKKPVRFSPKNLAKSAYKKPIQANLDPKLTPTQKKEEEKPTWVPHPQ